MPPFAGDFPFLWLTAPSRVEEPPPPQTFGQLDNTDDWDFSCNANAFRQQRRLQKRVSFAIYDNKTHEVLHVRDYSHHERIATWFSPKDLKEQKKECKHDIEAYDRGNKSLCLRGLEVRRSTDAKRRRKQKKADHRFAVLQEFCKQKVLGRLEPERLARVSLNISENCYRKANQIGLQDEREAISVRKIHSMDTPVPVC